jgi:hypothetical protein
MGHDPAEPADIVLDLLLDLRNERDARPIVPVLDRLLAVIGHRSLLTADETLLLLDELDEAVELTKDAEDGQLLELSPAGRVRTS